MSTPRMLWLLFCLAWAGFWLTFGWVFVPFLNLFLAAGSVGAFWLPVGRDRLSPPPASHPVRRRPDGSPDELDGYSSVYRRDYPRGLE